MVKQSEAQVLADCLKEVTRLGGRVFRNNVGVLKDINGRPVRYGLCVGSADLIGIYESRFLSIECKATGKRIKPDSAQDKWRKMVISQGGIAFECDDAKNLKKLIDAFL